MPEYDFHRITIDTIAARLDELLKVEGVTAEEKAVRYVAKAGDGSMRDALSLLDQCIAFYLGQELTYDKVWKFWVLLILKCSVNFCVK